MRRTFAVLVPLVLAGSILCAPTPAGAAPAHVKHSCISAYASLYPRHVHVGDLVSAGAGWENCGQSVYFRYEFRVTSPCEPPFRYDGHMRLRKGYGFGISFAPFRACRGTYRATTKAFHDGQLVGRMSQYLHVRP